MNEAALFQIAGAVLQVAFVLVIAGIVWLIFGRKRSSFTRYVGLHGTSAVAAGAATVLGLALSLLLLVPEARELASGPDTLVAQIVNQLGRTDSIAVLLVVAVFKTAFAEELLFRGLIAKRLIAWLGFSTGNILQALIFGSIHLLIFTTSVAGAAPWLAAVSAAILGWVNGWLNERLGKGSILPGWIVHGLGNSITYLTVAFYVLSE
jgi:uncharacterized protein